MSEPMENRKKENISINQKATVNILVHYVFSVFSAQ